MFKGIILSSGILILIFLYLCFFITPKAGGVPISLAEALIPTAVISPFVLIAGGTVGYFAEHHIFSEGRSPFMQIFIFSMCIYVLGAILIGMVMIFADGSHPGGLAEKLAGGLALGGTGALLFAVFFIPLIAVLSYLLSKWTD